MAELTLPPQTVDDAEELDPRQRVVERRRRFAATIDVYLVLTVAILVAVGLMMVWSSTLGFGPEQQATIFFQQARNAVFGVVVMFVVGSLDYRLWRRLAI